VLAALVGLAGLTSTAAAQSSWFNADVMRTESRWTADGSRIVTDATVRLADGSERVVSQLGGTAGGYTQVVWHGQPELEAGMRVRLSAHLDGAVWIADDVIVQSSLTGAVPYVRTVTKKSGKKLYWAKSCIEVRRNAAGTSAIEDEEAVITASIAAWNTGLASCTYLDLVDLGTEDREVSGEDRVNVIIFRDDTWCRPAVDGDKARCFSAAAAGVTTVTFVDEPGDDRDGEIIDADVELNNVTFRLTHEGMGTNPREGLCDADLGNTLVHELGHLLGLEHTCRGSGDPPRFDQTGALIPLCAETIDPVITEATMYPFQDCGETKKATPEPDDIAAVCETYPVTDDPVICEPPDEVTGSCCDASRRAPTGGALLALLILARLLSARPRRSALRP
jgi:hypothetical protein